MIVYMSYYAKWSKNKLNFLYFGTVLCHMLSETCWDLRFDCYKSYEEKINSPETLTKGLALYCLSTVSSSPKLPMKQEVIQNVTLGKSKLIGFSELIFFCYN